MRIGIDASRAGLAVRAGTEIYSYQLLRSLLELPACPDIRYVLYTRGELPSDLPSPNCAERRAVGPSRLWTLLGLSREMWRRPPDLLFVPAHVLPPLHPRRSVVTVHDLAHLAYPRAYPPATWSYLALTTWYHARAATRIIVPSEATGADLQRRLGVPPARISVVPSGVGPEFGPRPPAEVAATLKRLEIQRPYLLYVGTLQPRKNLLRLIAAFDLVRRSGHADLRLVLAGAPGWGAGSVLAQARRTPGVDVLGYVPANDLPDLYNGAAALALVSLYEGFGFPVVEAMACGVPVVAGRHSSLPELAGETAILVNAEDVAAIAAGLRRAVEDVDLAADLRCRGPARARLFNWTQAAEATRSVLLEVLGYV